MGKNSFYLGEVGNATKMNLVLQTMMGVTLAGLAEGMALADRAGLQQKVATIIIIIRISLRKPLSGCAGGAGAHRACLSCSTQQR